MPRMFVQLIGKYRWYVVLYKCYMAKRLLSDCVYYITPPLQSERVGALASGGP